MVSTEEFLPRPESIKAKDVKIGDVAKIYDTELFIARDDGRRQLTARVKFKGEERTIYFNKASVKALATDLGKDSDDWNGRDVAVNEINPTNFGKTVIWGAAGSKAKK